MARVNVYLPDDLAAEVKASGINVSAVAQEALRSALAAHRTNEWLDRIKKRKHPRLDHDFVAETMAAVKDEWETGE